MQYIAIFASGKGSNAETICRYFSKHQMVKVSCIVSNKQNAGVFEVASRFNIPFFYLSPDLLKSPSDLLLLLKKHKVNFIVLAGYLKQILPEMISAYPRKIINIHPALLPKFGGKGMYGMYVHEAVAKEKEKESGITIHYVDEHYDEGEIIFQTQTQIDSEDSPQRIAEKVLQLEHQYFAPVIETVIENYLKKIN